jgi:hypothetical protein
MLNNASKSEQCYDRELNREDGEVRRSSRWGKSSSGDRSHTWCGDAVDDGEDVHEVDEAPGPGEPAQRPRQRRHAGPALADRHVHVVGTAAGGGRRSAAALALRVAASRGGDAAAARLARLLGLQLLDLPRAAAVAVARLAAAAVPAVQMLGGSRLGHRVRARAQLGVTHVRRRGWPKNNAETSRERGVAVRRLVPVCLDGGEMCLVAKKSSGGVRISSSLH